MNIRNVTIIMQSNLNTIYCIYITCTFPTRGTNKSYLICTVFYSYKTSKHPGTLLANLARFPFG